MPMQSEQPAPPPPPIQPTLPATSYGAPTNTLAVVSLASGIISWFALPIIGGVVAVVAGHLAKSEIRRTGEQGNTYATIGLILGYLHLAVVLLVVLILLLVFAGTFAIIRAATG